MSFNDPWKSASVEREEREYKEKAIEKREKEDKAAREVHAKVKDFSTVKMFQRDVHDLNSSGWERKINPFGTTKDERNASDKLAKETSTLLGYKPRKDFIKEGRACTDCFCGLIFAVCLAGLVATFWYALENGDPKKVYHGMDWQGNLCGVDLPLKPYVYWCRKVQQGTDPSTLDTTTDLAELDFKHAICLASCPISSDSQSSCYNSETGQYNLVADYPTRGVGERYCVPQEEALLNKYNAEIDAHQLEKYVNLFITNAHEGWELLLGVFGGAFILNLLYLVLIDCFAWVVVWTCLLVMFLVPAFMGSYLVYASQNGGVDGIPNSSDAESDKFLGCVLCVVAAVFLCIICCMQRAIHRSIVIIDITAECLFDCRSLLLEPLFNLVLRSTFWFLMIVGGGYLIGCGKVERDEVYRTFYFSTIEKIMLVFFVLMWIWVNEFMTAASQYTLANASARWYFTPIKGGSKRVGACQLCQGYCNVGFHFGSLAFGSFLIAFLRPIRWILMFVVYSEILLNNVTYGCTRAFCGCFYECFKHGLEHLSKNAFIAMAIQGDAFCMAGRVAADFYGPTGPMKEGAKKGASGYDGTKFHVLSGAAWFFTLTGLGSVVAVGTITAGIVVENCDTFSEPTSKYFVADPIVFCWMAGLICFAVSLGFMIVFDCITDTIFLCAAMDYHDLCKNPVPPMPYIPAPDEGKTMFQSMFGCGRSEKRPDLEKAYRPTYWPQSLFELLRGEGAIPNVDLGLE